MKANATRDDVYEIHTNKCLKHDPSKSNTMSITTTMKKKGTVAMELSRGRERGLSASIPFVRL